MPASFRRASKGLAPQTCGTRRRSMPTSRTEFVKVRRPGMLATPSRRLLLRRIPVLNLGYQQLVDWQKANQALRKNLQEAWDREDENHFTAILSELIDVADA